MGKINKTNRKYNQIERKVFDNRFEFVNKKTGIIVRTVFISPNVQLYKKYVKNTGNLGV